MNATLIDTSFCVAAYVLSHPKNDVAIRWLEGAKNGDYQAYLCLHSIAEFYATLTRMPVRPRISGKQAYHLIFDELLTYCSVVVLDEADYKTVLSLLSASELVGGLIFDALIAHAAVKVGANRILTLNTKDFPRAYPGLQAEIVSV